MQPHMSPAVISASLRICLSAAEGREAVGGESGDLRPKGERDQLPSQILSSSDVKAWKGPHNARDADTERPLAGGFSLTVRVSCGWTHNNPTAKTAAMPTLRLTGIFNVDMQKKGIKNINTSETTLMNAAEMITAARLKQRPGMSGIHILRCGTHIKRVVKK